MSGSNLQKVSIKAPATTANLGPGFDCLGIAWTLANTIEFSKSDKLVITGTDEKYLGEDNLAYKAFSAALRKAGIEDRGVAINFADTNIPISRGLGSSSSLISAGIEAANELYGLGMSADDMFALATEVEGHPDNVAPAIYGGFTASLLKDGVPTTVHFPVSDKFYFAALVPDFQLSTEYARAVLPKEVPMKDAVFCTARIAMLIKAFGEGDAELLKIAMEDRLHEPYRSKLIDGFDEVHAKSLECGAAVCCISGAGPTLLCISEDSGFAARMKAELAKIKPNWKLIELEKKLVQ